jgi:hypothetical protein
MSDVGGLSPSPRRIAKPSWLDLRFVLGLVLVLGAVLAGAALFAGANHRYPMVVATRDLAAGKVLHQADLTLAQVQLPERGTGIYLDSLSAALGKQLQRPVAAGELVPAGAVRSTTAQTTVTVPFASAAAPDLHPGQRIEIWVSTPSCASVVVLPDVTVQDVRPDSSGSFTSGTGGQDVVISVEPALANRVVAALAIDQAQVRAGVLTGNQSSRPTSAPVLPGAASGGDPADLARCAGSSGS